MGCGCGKSKNTRDVRAAATRKITLAKRLAATESQRKEKQERRKMVEERLKFCKGCPHSIQTKDEIRKKTRACHKSNISIQSLINKKDFKCPIGKF